ncbi:MAG TPA: hypothetical protein VGD94_16975 [Vicinamibacterales bacterium]
MPASTSPPVSHERWRLAAVWAGLLTGPLVWLALLQTNYVLAYVACEVQRTWFIHLATAVAVLLVASAGYAAWRASFGEITADETLTHPLADETRVQRSRWMSLAGVAFSAWFIVVILAMEVPVIVLKECQ